jgi:hypothetical protein
MNIVTLVSVAKPLVDCGSDLARRKRNDGSLSRTNSEDNL